MKALVAIMPVTVILLTAVCSVQAERTEDVKYGFRAKPKTNHLTLVIRAENNTDRNVEFVQWESFRPVLSYYKLDDPRRRLSSTALFSGSFWTSVKPHETKQLDPRFEEIFPFGFSSPRTKNERTGLYLVMSWHGIEICFGLPDVNGHIPSPVINPANPDVEMYLGFIFHHPIREPDVVFLFLNGTDGAIDVENPLTQAGRITIHAPEIDYTDELHLRGDAPETVMVDAGVVREWTLPWTDILALIPEKDLARINAAGGRFDLVWQAAGRQSLKLPVVLPQPGEKEWRGPPVPPRHGGPVRD